MSATTKISKQYIIKVKEGLYLYSTSLAYNVSVTKNKSSAYVFYEEAFKDGYVNEVLSELVKYGFSSEVIEITTKVEVTEHPIIATETIKSEETK